MSTIIIYATKHGCTEKIANTLSKKLEGEVCLHNLKKDRTPDIKDYEKIILGGSIHIGKIQTEVKEFCLKNIEILTMKKIGLFVCGMNIDQAETELKSSFPDELYEYAVTKEFFGGEFIFKKMNPLDRLMVKKIAKVGTDTSNILEKNINQFVELMNQT